LDLKRTKDTAEKAADMLTDGMSEEEVVFDDDDPDPAPPPTTTPTTTPPATSTGSFFDRVNRTMRTSDEVPSPDRSPTDGTVTMEDLPTDDACSLDNASKDKIAFIKLHRL
jgi:hypothetical protein